MATLFQETLLDSETNLSTDEYIIDASVVPAGSGAAWSVRKYTLRGGLQEGVDVVEIDNGKLRFAVLPTRGMGILKAGCGDVRLGWDSPVKDPVHPSFVNLQDRGGLGWLRGFNEWIVRCGLSSMGAPGTDVMFDNNGNPSEEFLTLHGKIANLPARKLAIEITDEAIILRGEVDETMLFGPALRLNTEIRTSFASAALSITDTVTNIGRNATEHQLLYHINQGGPILEKGARVMLPYKQVAPRDARAAEGIAGFDRYDGPVAGFVEQAYFFELAGKRGTQESLAMLRNAKGNQASVLRYSLKDFPCFTLWKNTAALEDGYVTGLEPATAYPSARSFERSKGRVITLQGGESRTTSLSVEALDTRKAVQAVEKEIQALQKRVQPKVHAQPIAKFSDV
ncbi:aldose 1-epimerase family protein [Coraliomargarita parva]|uniref:aldose 1-epimerase family protein n=1 Tax=Coraliomargarita parva TaxID=3014050 RepID=UPI0022B56A68|nr:aldose 1-epimerase family protein [Coraliomargarita parva]